jgi:hypothetical protein
MSSRYQALDGKIFGTEQEACDHNLSMGETLCDMTVKQLQELCQERRVLWRGQRKARLVAHLMGMTPQQVTAEEV